MDKGWQEHKEFSELPTKQKRVPYVLGTGKERQGLAKKPSKKTELERWHGIVGRSFRYLWNGRVFANNGDVQAITIRKVAHGWQAVIKVTHRKKHMVAFENAETWPRLIDKLVTTMMWGKFKWREDKFKKKT